MKMDSLKICSTLVEKKKKEKLINQVLFPSSFLGKQHALLTCVLYTLEYDEVLQLVSVTTTKTIYRATHLWT
jgi:hypothetical protein